VSKKKDNDLKVSADRISRFLSQDKISKLDLDKALEEIK
jgi:hypothetical protein